MDERVVREPRQDFRDPRGVTRQGAAQGRMYPQPRGHLAPVSIWLRSHRRLIRNQTAENAKADRLRRFCEEAKKRLFARKTGGKQSFVAGEPLDACAR